MDVCKQANGVFCFCFVVGLEWVNRGSRIVITVKAEPCHEGFEGAGPTCWVKPPANYVASSKPLSSLLVVRVLRRCFSWILFPGSKS
jgi:hypothetical protein